MRLITDAALPYLPVEDPEFHANPTPFVEEARQQHPWLAKFSTGYIIHGYDALKELARMDDKLEMGLGSMVAFYEAEGTPWARFMEEMLQSHSRAGHQRLRASVAEAFTPRRANQVRPLMQKVITELLDEWTPRGEFDFAEFAAFFPIGVLCGILGVSTDTIPGIRAAIETHMTAFAMDMSLRPNFMASFDALWKWVDDMVIEHEKADDGKNDGLLHALIAAKNAGSLSENELRDMLLDLLIAGYDTSKNMLTLSVHQLILHPQYWPECAERIEFCARVVDEMLRHTGIATFFRTVREDFDYAGLRFPKGTMLAFATPLADRDPKAFPDPLRFDPERKSANRHVAFGRGEHICLGQHLARAQLEEGLHLIARRIKNPQLNGEISWRPFLGAWGLKTLPIRFETIATKHKPV